MKISDNNHKILQTCTNNLPKAVRKVQYRRIKSYTNNQTNVINATASIFLLLLISRPMNVVGDSSTQTLLGQSISGRLASPWD